MDEERILRKLAAAARGDAPEPVNVAEAVLARLAEARQPRMVLPWVFATAAAAAAAIVVAVAPYVAAARQDPVGELLESMMAVSL